MTKPLENKIDYQKRADECALHATTAANEHARDVWRQMQAYWLKRAAESSPSIRISQTPAPKLLSPKTFA